MVQSVVLEWTIILFSGERVHADIKIELSAVLIIDAHPKSEIIVFLIIT